MGKAVEVSQNSKEANEKKQNNNSLIKHILQERIFATSKNVGFQKYWILQFWAQFIHFQGKTFCKKKKNSTAHSHNNDYIWSLNSFAYLRKLGGLPDELSIYTQLFVHNLFEGHNPPPANTFL